MWRPPAQLVNNNNRERERERERDVTCAAGEMDHRLYDCFAVAVMTHGYEGNAFVGVDGESFTLTDLMTPIRRCQTLAGKPKICIIQVSRLV